MRNLVRGILLFQLGCSATPHPVWTDTTPHTTRLVTISPGVRLEVLDWGGHGETLVLLSGLQDVAHGFDDFAPRLTDSFHVVGITRRGYGASSQTAEGYDLAGRIEDLRIILDSLGLQAVVLVGHSIAGDDLTGFAGAYPERVRGLVYLDAAFDHSDLGPVLSAQPALPPMQAADSASPAAVQTYLKRTYGMTVPESQLRAIARYDAGGHLRADVTPSRIDSLMLAGGGHPAYERVRTPALVIDAVVDSAPQLFPSWSSLSPETQAQARRFTEGLQTWATAQKAQRQERLRGAVLLEIHGANHYVFDSHREEVLTAMRRFLAGIL